MEMDLGLKGKKAIVTGGTRGIGRAIASLLAAEGCDVAICARHKDAVEETVATLGRAGIRATGGAVDVADLPALRRWVGEAAETLGGIDIFVANVSALAQGMDEEAWRKGSEIDVMGTVFGIEARSEEHTSELQSPCNLVCRLLLEKKKTSDSCPSLRARRPALPPGPDDRSGRSPRHIPARAACWRSTAYTDWSPADRSWRPHRRFQ